jgi:hypothetical protein
MANISQSLAPLEFPPSPNNGDILQLVDTTNTVLTEYLWTGSHWTATGKATHIDEYDARYVNVIGDTVVGNLTLDTNVNLVGNIDIESRNPLPALQITPRSDDESQNNSGY